MLKIPNNDLYTYPQQINDNLWVLGNYFINIYLVIGSKKSALVEIGISAIVDSVISQLERIGIEPDYLVLTHPHADHVTGYNGLRERYPSAETIVAKGAIDFLNHPKAEKSLIAEDKFMTRRLSEINIMPGRPPISKAPNIESPIVIENEIVLKLGGIEIHLHKAKGHSPGNLIGFIPSIHTVIASDSIGFFYYDRFILPLFLTGYIESLKTIDKVISFDPKIICIGHQGPIWGQKPYKVLQDARNSLVKLHAEIIGKDFEGNDISEQLFRKYYVNELTLYSATNMQNCMRLLVKRSTEAKRS